MFLPEKHAPHSVIIAQYLDDGRGLLALPNGTAQLDELPAFSLQTNRLGVAMANGPGLVRYRSRYDEGATFDSAPVAEDATVPDSEEATIAQVAAELGLKPGLEPRRALQIVAAYFRNRFEYSSYLTGDRSINSSTFCSRLPTFSSNWLTSSSALRFTL